MGRIKQCWVWRCRVCMCVARLEANVNEMVCEGNAVGDPHEPIEMEFVTTGLIPMQDVVKP